MANEKIQKSYSSTCDIENTRPSSAQDCADVIHISIFFDGSGNNKDVDEKEKKWSNPARIWRSSRIFADRNTAAYPIYISGVGTPFNGTPLFPGDEHLIKLQDMDAVGGFSGAGGSRRIDFGHQQINDALRTALLSRARKLDDQVKRYAESAKKESFSDVNRTLHQHRLIKQINVSIFGFSRGAALARAFCNQWLWRCKDKKGQLLYEGYPIRFVFMGIFDTVASFGLPSANISNSPLLGSFEGRDLVVDDRVGRCVHYVAAHELRFSFPVDLVRKDGKLPSHWLEKVYPGMHSDVGGGYEPMDQGITNNYARIPMRDMMNEALNKGARLLSSQQIMEIDSPLFIKYFECKPETESAYQAYKAVCNPKGTVEHCIREHMKQLYSAYGTLKRQGGVNLTARQHQKGESWIGGPKDIGTEMETYERLRSELSNPLRALQPDADVGYLVSKGAHAMWIQPQEWQKKAWYATASQGVASFINSYIHDSKVGFLNNIEPFSYFSQRGVSESNRSIYGWLEYNVNRPVNHAVEAVTDYATEKGQQAKQAATEAVEKVHSTAQQAADYASAKAEQVWDATKDAAQRSKDMAGEAAKQTQQAVSNAVNKAADTAVQAGKAVGETTQSTLHRLGQAWGELLH